MARLGWLILAASLLIASTAFAASEEIEHRCTGLYPNVWQYFAWKDCVKAETKREMEATLKRLKEENARPCIAADLARMESLAVRAKAAIKAEWTLERSKSELESIIGREGVISIPDDDIKERVLVFSILSKCDSPFRFLINVRAAQNGSLRWLRTWALEAPTGYQGNYQAQLSADFDAQRFEERLRIEKAKRDEELQNLTKKQQQEQEEQRAGLLRSVKISGAQMTCATNDCSFQNLKFFVTNVSQMPILRVSFGWMFRPSETATCPSKLATNHVEYAVLQPSEKKAITIFAFNASKNSNSDFCLGVTDVELPFAWQRR